MASIHNRHKISLNLKYLSKFSGKIAYCIIFVCIFLYFENTVNGQVQATGHVFAEIVEPTVLTCETTNYHSISSENCNGECELLLAEVKISGKNVNIGVSILSDNLQTATGGTMLFSAYACQHCASDGSTSLPNESVFTLKGIPGEMAQIHDNSTFNGQYRVTFMYD